MKTTPNPIKPSARGLFHWTAVSLPRRWNSKTYVGHHKTTYIVFGQKKLGPHPADRICLGAIKRCEGGWKAYPRGKDRFLDQATNGVFPTREKASIGLVVYLNRYAYGRARLDHGGITDWRTPR
jgi:hypothetical protein